MKPFPKVMSWILLALALCCGLVWNAEAQGVPIVFSIPPHSDPNKIFVQFLNDDNLQGTFVDPNGVVQTLAPNTSYSMSQITSTLGSVGGGAPTGSPAVFISSYISGRVYINYGDTGLVDLTSGYIPDAIHNVDNNYYTRYQYLEPTITGSTVTVDLSYIDFAAISLSMEAKNAPHALNSPQLTTVTGQGLVSTTAGTAVTSGANVLPSSNAILPSTDFARVIGPNMDGSYYHDWTNYLQTTFQGQTALLQGFFVGVGDQPSGNPLTQAQSYVFLASVDTAGNVTLTAQAGSGNGYAACVPTVQQGTGVGSTNQTVAITFDALNAITGVYGNNPAYTINDNGSITTTNGIVNDIYGRVVGDFLAGLSFGFVASSTQFNGKTIGSLSSTEWWGGTMPDGTFIQLADTPAGQNICFGAAQPNQPLNYHTYAACLLGQTQGYGFPLQDRLGNNLLVLDTSQDPAGYLLVTINPDTSATIYHSMHMLL